MDSKWVEVVGKHGEWDNYFRYYEWRADGTTWFRRRARKGYEYLEHNHSPLKEILQLVSTHESAKN